MSQKNLFITIFLLSILFQQVCAQTSVKRKNYDIKKRQVNEIIIINNNPEKIAFDQTFTIRYSPVEYVSERKWSIAKNVSQDKNTGRCLFYAETPTLAILQSIWKESKKSLLFLLEPGDSVHVTCNKNGWSFSGKGYEKLQLQFQIDSALNTLAIPANPKDYITESLEDYLEWHRYLNKHLDVIIPIIDAYKNRLSAFAYNLIRARFVTQNIDDRSDKFGSFWSYALTSGMTNEDIASIYDSTYLPGTSEWFKYASTYVFGTWKPIMYAVNRMYSFNKDNNIMSTSLGRKMEYFKMGILTYKGVPREKFITSFVKEEFIQEQGFIPETENILSNYYTEPDFPEYKTDMKQYERAAREKINEKDAPDFKLFDKNGSEFNKAKFLGKIVLFDFWFTGCVACQRMLPYLKIVEETFKNDTNVIFINVSIDKVKSQWLSSLAEGKYTTGMGLSLYTGGEGDDNDIIRQYAITGYPSIHLMDPYGRILRLYPKPDPRKDNGKRLIETIRKQLAYIKDGPYVLYEKESKGVKAISVCGSTLISKEIKKANQKLLSIQTDNKEALDIELKKSLSTEKSEYAKPENLFVLSDIEGNFSALRKLLQANGIIDENYNWIFGRGHLVFAGDMFDRGMQVTECLWLIYSLEEKAKVAGGYVHFILGNHEIMNLQGNFRYTQVKYKNNATLIGKSLKDLYGENSELGRWLRTKNIIEKIGDLLFVHGGIAKEFSDSVSLKISEINEIVRKHIGIEINSWEHPDTHVRLIFSPSFSPFWFRQYYYASDKRMWLRNDHSIKWTIEKPDLQELNKILSKWNVERIVTGHTIVADTISVHYEGKVINTDTKHAEGKSEALLIMGNNYYRVNADGKKVLLFTDPNNELVLAERKKELATH